MKASACGLALLGLTGCGLSEVSVNVGSQQTGQVAEIDGHDIIRQLGSTELMVKDNSGRIVPSQVTYDSMLLIIPQDNYQGEYLVSVGKSQDKTLTCGRTYPERQDDLCWENDLVGFRAYGPGTQAKGEKLFGYDLFLKRNTTSPVIEELIRTDHDPEVWRMVDSLRSQGLDNEADSLINKISYHVDHGFGMDCYAVGPTLGPGVTAIVGDSGLIYPWCYKDVEILDNGPLRFTAILYFEPVVVNCDTVTEIRKITLDAGSNMNTTEIRYEGLTRQVTIATGIVLHDEGERWVAPDSLSIAYVDPTQGTDNGSLFIGNKYVSRPDSIAVFDCDGLPHLLAFRQYNPETVYTYYWGVGWNRGNIASFDAWKKYLMNEK